MTKRQQIINAIKARFQTILISNGYSSNLGRNVYEWQVTPISDDRLPAIAFSDPNNSIIDAEAINRFRWALTIDVVITARSETAVADIRNMISDVHKAIGVDERWDGLAIMTKQPEDTIRIEQTEKREAGAKISFVIIYDTEQWKM